MRYKSILFLLFLPLLLAFSIQGTNPIKVKPFEIINGQTLKVDFPDGSQEIIRIIGINAPKIEEPANEAKPTIAASDRVNDLVLAVEVTLYFDSENDYRAHKDSSNKIIAHVVLPDGSYLGEKMLKEGLCRFDGSHPFDPKISERYKKAASSAKDKKLGLWKAPPKIPPKEKLLLELKSKETPKSKIIEKPFDEIFEVTISLLTEAGYAFSQVDPSSGTISTEWKERNSGNSNIGVQMVEGLWMAVSNIDKIEHKVFIFVRKIKPDISKVTVSFSAKGSNRYDRSTNFEVPQRDYDVFFDRLCKKLGISLY